MSSVAKQAAPIPLVPSESQYRFPTGALPEVLAQVVGAVAEATQTDPGMAGTTALAVLSAIAGGHASITVRPGWVEGVNLFTLISARPGERKSAVQQLMTRPLITFESALREHAMPAYQEALTRQLVLEKAVDHANQRASRAEANGDDSADELLANAIGLARRASDVVVPALPRLLADDVTPEALGSLLLEQDGRMTIFSAEGGGLFDIMAGRYSPNTSLDPLLKGHSGDPLRVDRRGRPSEFVQHPALTISLMAQPQVLSTIGSNTRFSGRGLLARFLYSVPPSRLGRRATGRDGLPFAEMDAYNELIAKMARALRDAPEPIGLAFDREAASLINELEASVEPEMAPEVAEPDWASWCAKYVGAVCRIAALLHLVDYSLDRASSVIPASSVRSAIELGTYYWHHSRAVFGQMGMHQSLMRANQVLEVMRRLGGDSVSERDIFTSLPRSRFTNMEALRRALNLLEEFEWIERLPSQQSGRGRPPSPRWKLLPTAESAEPQKVAIASAL